MTAHPKTSALFVVSHFAGYHSLDRVVFSVHGLVLAFVHREVADSLARLLADHLPIVSSTTQRELELAGFTVRVISGGLEIREEDNDS